MMLFTAKGNRGKVLSNKRGNLPSMSFYELSAPDIHGQPVKFNTLKGRKVLIVNTASNCGYTGQYTELQKLHEVYRDRLTIIAFPSDEFGNQEPGENRAIEQFCRLNYGVTFQIMSKSKVLRSAEQNEVYRWLTTPGQNGWNSHEPEWNFGKYLINEKGILERYFGPAVYPGGREFAEALKATHR